LILRLLGAIEISIIYKNVEQNVRQAHHYPIREANLCKKTS